MESLNRTFESFMEFSHSVQSNFKVEDALPYDTADDEMISCMKSLKRTNQKKHRPKLKKIKNKVDKLNEKLTKRLTTSKSPLKRTHWESGKHSREWNR